MSLARRVISIYKQEGIVSLIYESISFVSNKLAGTSSAGSYPMNPSKLRDLSDDELLSIIQHEAHRIEKAVYNDILDEKEEYYSIKCERVEKCITILVNERDYTRDHPVINWATNIQSILDETECTWIPEKSSSPPGVNINNLDEFANFVENRRSTRVWADKQDQPSEEQLRIIANQMIEGAKWAPNSGNRQAWRFKIIISDQEKNLLDRIKEEHTVSAPLLIFVGMDARVYGDVADSEISIYLDAGAAIMQMILTAHNAGLGTCWNHFGTDLIRSRKINQTDYQEFANQLNIPDYIEPMAIVCVGVPEFIPPIPERSSNEKYLIS